jgi:hypothetical protein
MKKPTAHDLIEAPAKPSSNDLAPLIIKVRGIDRIGKFPRSLLGNSQEFFVPYWHTPLQKKKDAIVELTLPPNANIHAREYQLYLPSKEMLRQTLLDWMREQEMKP